MSRIRHIIGLAAVLLVALAAGACVHPLVHENAELMVSLYIPDVLATKAETGGVNPSAAEQKITSLQIWVFLPSGRRAAYEEYDLDDPETPAEATGLTHNAITRFAMRLDPPMFDSLTLSNATADVFAVVNAQSLGLTKNTTRSELEEAVMKDDYFGVDPLTMAVPADGLPMSGILRNAPVTGGYPVLNISTLSLTRAVSKIRFVFVQQAEDGLADPLEPLNDQCVIKSITFDGTAGGADCLIAAEEYFLTEETYPGTDNLFAIDGYTVLAATLAKDNAPLIANHDMTCYDYPELLAFRSVGHELESAQDYETRLDAAVALTSQVGPIYIRETDKPISGTILYNTGDVDKTVHFTMGADDMLTRNHSWIVFAYFAEETRTLQLDVKVLPWSWTEHPVNFEDGSVNVIRRYTATETSPATFKKEQTKDGFFDVTFWHTVNGHPNQIEGDILISTPVGAKIWAVPVPGSLTARTFLDSAIYVTPQNAVISPTYNSETGAWETRPIKFTVKCHPRYAGSQYDDALDSLYVDLHFCIECANDKWIDLGSESVDSYRFILKKNWDE